MSDKLIEFKCKLIKQRFNSDSFKIYVVDVDLEKFKLSTNRNNEVVLIGDIPNLLPNVTYIVQTNTEINKTFGIQYKVKNIRSDKPNDIDSSKTFLYEIITKNQADTLLEVYPDIIDKIIRNDLKNIDLNLTKGIKKITFEKIKEKIIENFVLIDLVNLFKGYISISTIRKLYDKYTSIEIVRKNLSENPYKCLCGISKIGFKTSDTILLQLESLNKDNPNDEIITFTGDLKTSKQRMLACIDYILSQNELSGNTKMEIQELRNECFKLSPECISKFVEIIKENNNLIHVDYKNKFVSSKIAYETEKYIRDTILKGLENNKFWNINPEVYRQLDGISLTDEQMESLSNVCNYNISILTAPAGSGKSQSIKNIITMLEEHGKRFLLCTPTGKSSEVLADYCKREAGTIHRQLNYNPNNNPSWGFNEENKLKTEIVIVDEFSMTDIYLMKNLLDAIDIKKTKLLLVFDSYQLPSVGCGNIAQDLLSSGLIPTTKLNKIFRYNEGGLMQVATEIRNSEQFLPSDFIGNKIFGINKDFAYMETYQIKIKQQVLKIYKKLLTDGYSINDILILTCQNKGDYGTKMINSCIQYYIQKDKNNHFLMRGKDKFFKGDKVIQVVNNYKALNIDMMEEHVYNGNTGIIVDVDYNELIVDFGDKKIIYSKEELNQLELGYCITIHKIQGSQGKQVIVLAPKSHSFMLNSNLLYVAVTRAKERVYLLGNIITINRAIKKKENLCRNTWLPYLLKEAKYKLNKIEHIEV
ncbi:TPA: AAA family ATPase [Clostridioides difficile]|uniref:AAA family ATPase n=1 Tax=Clostridioides difficile TaxID=1496 RepID=UPI000B3CA357|nr:AAA family ATPase [Clostridioides difficile]HBF8685579.1 AAA family ATPase [Clostridioides difficile]